jgi:thiol-disulfide isomerase/thioredoxin
MTLLLAAALALTDASGARHDLADYKGKVVLINFWATWCEPCREELPGIERLAQSLAGKPFVVLAVQTAGSARSAQDTAGELHLHFAMLPDRDSSVTKAWNVTLLPTSFLVGPDGAIAYRHAGELDWSSPKARRRVQALLPRR